MVNRVQTLRSSTPGQVPASGTRQPGELWLNFADKQIGYIDASGVAQKVQAVRFFSNLTTYALGDCVLNAGSLYIANGAVPAGAFNATQWQLIGGANFSYLPTAGGTMTGALVISAGGVSVTGGGASVTGGPVNLSPANSNVTVSPTGTGTLTANPAVLGHIDNVAIGQTTPAAVKTNALLATGGSIDGTVIGAATPAAASFTSLNGGQFGGRRNMLMNGRGLVDQRYNNAANNFAIAGVNYFGDRWGWYQTVAGSFFQLQSGGSIGGYYNGAQGSVSAVLQNAYTPAAADLVEIFQVIEGYNCSKLGWGFTSALPATLSFDAYVTVAGTYCVSILSYTVSGATRGYIASFTLVANSWQTVKLTIPGDTAGIWPADARGSIMFRWNLGYGSNGVAAGGSWQNIPASGAGSNFAVTAGAVNLVQGPGNPSFAITNVQFEQGTVATPYENIHRQAEIDDCMRYFYFDQVGIMTYNGTGVTTVISGQIRWPVQMRATPTVLTGNTVNNAATNMNTFVAYQSTPPGWFQTGWVSASAEF